LSKTTKKPFILLILLKSQLYTNGDSILFFQKRRVLMKFSKGLMVVALCAMSFGVITPSSYFERAKAKAQALYGQAQDTYNKYGSSAKDMYGQAKTAYDKYGRPMYDKYGRQIVAPIKDKYQDLRSKAVDYMYKPSASARDAEEAQMAEMAEAAGDLGVGYERPDKWMAGRKGN
jgi:hypothetical protein